MKLKKRSKRSRLRGQKTCGYGFRKKHRGKGSKGGKGMAGTGKRADQKKTFIIKYYPEYFGKKGFKSKKKRLEVINLIEIEKKLPVFLKQKIAKKISGGTAVDLPNYKILGMGKPKQKLFIKASAFSKKAKEKIEQAGGKIEIVKKEKIGEVKKEKIEQEEKKEIIEKRKKLKKEDKKIL